jgi:hypothetical protein
MSDLIADLDRDICDLMAAQEATFSKLQIAVDALRKLDGNLCTECWAEQAIVREALSQIGPLPGPDPDRPWVNGYIGRVDGAS